MKRELSLELIIHPSSRGFTSQHFPLPHKAWEFSSPVITARNEAEEAPGAGFWVDLGKFWECEQRGDGDDSKPWHRAVLEWTFLEGMSEWPFLEGIFEQNPIPSAGITIPVGNIGANPNSQCWNCNSWRECWNGHSCWEYWSKTPFPVLESPFLEAIL